MNLAINSRAGLPTTSRQCHELTTHELDQLATEKDFADCMADIVIVARQYRFLMARLGVGRWSA